MQRTLDSIRLPLADILSPFNDVRWPEKSSEVRRELHSPQEGIDLRDQKKTPKQAGRRLSKQENTQRKAPGSSPQCLQGHGTHSGSRCVVSYRRTLFPYFRMSCVCVCARVYVSQSICHHVRLFVLTISITGIINCTLEFAPFQLCRMLLYVEECYCIVFTNLRG